MNADARQHVRRLIDAGERDRIALVRTVREGGYGFDLRAAKDLVDAELATLPDDAPQRASRDEASLSAGILAGQAEALHRLADTYRLDEQNAGERRAAELLDRAAEIVKEAARVVREAG